VPAFNPTQFYESSALYESGAPYNGYEFKGDNPGPWLVEIGVDLFVNGVGEYFTLDDATKGVLDNTDFLLAGEVMIDITRYVRRLSVSRGRSAMLEKFTSGSCSITLDNRDRLFDPTVTGSPLSGQIVPRKQVKVFYTGVPVFTGNISDWNFNYTFADAEAEIVANDPFAFLATKNVPAQTMTAETVSERIAYVLAQVGWNLELATIATDTIGLTADVVGDDVNALTYLQKCELSTNGLFFSDKSGVVTFLPSYTGVPSQVAVGVDGGVPCDDFQVLYGSEDLCNSVTVNYFNAGVADSELAQDATSQENYGFFTKTYDTLLGSTAAAEGLASEIVTRYAEPTYRVEEISFNLNGISSSQVQEILSLDLGNQMRLYWRPLNVGETMNRIVVIDSINHDVTVSTHKVRMKITDIGENLRVGIG